jgi:hypothetical protein
MLALALGILVLGPVSECAGVMLKWDSNAEPDVAGYRIYARTANAPSTLLADVGNATTAVLPPLNPGVMYFFAVTAYNTAALESPPSREVAFVASAALPTPTPAPTASPSPTPPGPLPTPSPTGSVAPTPTPTPGGEPTPPPGPASVSSLLNVSTRGKVLSGENVMIGGFFFAGGQQKKVLIRAIGPSLAQSGLEGVLQDPVIQLFDSSGAIVASNDGWNGNADIALPPSDKRDAAMATPLDPGSYTIVVAGASNEPGLALFELYDFDQANGRIVQLSTRGTVETGNDILIGGFIIGGGERTTIVVRAIGPSLTGSGVKGVLADPELSLYDASGSLIFLNNDWRTHQEQQLIDSSLAPTDEKESAIIATLPPGSYSAVVRGANDSTGVGLIEIYNLAPQP